MLTPAMSAEEVALLGAFLSSCDRYVEFGAGGSTMLAATLVRHQVIATDSDPAWLDRVRNACRDAATPVRPELVHAEIGPTVAWGHPDGHGSRALWPAYHEAVWARTRARDADLFLVDGRFRVACVLRTLLEASAEALVAIHDFGVRPEYDPVLSFARPICAAGTLAVLRRRGDFDPRRAADCLREHAWNPC